MGNMAATADIVRFIEMGISYAISFHITTRIAWAKWRFLCEDVEVGHWVKGIPRKHRRLPVLGAEMCSLYFCLSYFIPEFLAFAVCAACSVIISDLQGLKASVRRKGKIGLLLL